MAIIVLERFTHPQHTPDDLWIIAVEPSAEVLALPLIQHLRTARPHIRMCLVGGDRIHNVGERMLYNTSGVHIHGLVDIFASLPRIAKVRNTLWQEAWQNPPRAIVFVDSVSASSRFFHSVSNHIKKIQYVAPMVWVWGKHRVKKFQGIDLMLSLFPFEAEYLQGVAKNVVCVGHPLLHPTPPMFERPALNPDKGLVIALYPGSRMGELRRHIPLLADIWRRLVALHRTFEYCHLPIHAVIPVLPQHADVVNKLVSDHIKPSTHDGLSHLATVRVVSDIAVHSSVMKSARVAIAASGTVNLELATRGVPHVMFGTIDILMRMAVPFVRPDMRWLHLVNRGCERTIIPEYMLNNINPERIAQDAYQFVGSRGDDMRVDIAQALNALKVDGDSSLNAAHAINALLNE